MEKDRSILPVIFIVSFVSLAYEITLTRVFSISLSYHFAFMVISIAMLGIAASGTLLSVYPMLKEPEKIPIYFLFFCISLPSSYLLMNIIPFDLARFSWDRYQIFYLSLYYFILSTPFFSFGLILATTFSNMTKETGHIYAADLCGGGAGALLILWMLSAGGPAKTVFLLSSIASIMLCIYSRRWIRGSAFGILLLNLIILNLQPQFAETRISPYKPLVAALRYPGAEHLKTYHSPFTRIDLFKSPAVRFAPGLSLKYLNELPVQTGISIDAADIYAITSDSDRRKLAFLQYLPSSLPYQISWKKEVLILEPKGGLSVLQAEYFRADNTYKIDSNPLVISSVREYQRGFSSDIYGKDTRSGLARSYLASTEKEFDLIEISLTGSVPGGSFGFSEDYRFTVEAFEEYLKHLTDEGMLSITLFLVPPPRIELRILGTLIRASEKSGIRDFGRHISTIRSWDTITILFKKSPLSEKEIKGIKTYAAQMRFDTVYYPGITEEKTNLYIKTSSNDIFYAFMKLLSPETRGQFMNDYPFDIRPVSDDSPYFHFYLKINNIKEIYRLIGEKWQYFIEEGYLLPALFIQVVFLSVFLLLLPLATFRKKVHSGHKSNAFLSLAYFALLGTGFMFIEISFIQKMVFPLENPSYAAASVLSSVLISSGIGSLLSQHLKIFKKPSILLFLSLTLLFYSLFLPTIINGITLYSLKTKVIIVIFMLMPAAILMGVPFPLGLSILGKTSPKLIPWALAVNGCFSVLSPVLAILFALSAGFTAVMLTGMVIYALAFVFLRRMEYGVV